MTLSCLREMFQHMAFPNTFYILGAGASAGIVPTTPEMRPGIKEAVRRLRSWPVASYPPTEAWQRAVGKNDTSTFCGPSGPEFGEILLAHVGPVGQDLLVQKALVAGELRGVNQYSVLRLVPKSLIFSFNLDGLAKKYCSDRHIVLTPHGDLDMQYLSPDVFPDLFEYWIDSDRPLPNTRTKTLLQPEPKTLTATTPYRIAALLLPLAPSVIVVGYSFSKRDDAESFEFFVDLLRRSPRPVFVIDRNPWEVAGSLNEAIRLHVATPVQADWRVLAANLWHVARTERSNTMDQISDEIHQKVYEVYHRLLWAPPHLLFCDETSETLKRTLFA